MMLQLNAGQQARKKRARQQRAYYLAHKEAERARRKAYYEAYKEEGKAYSKTWRLAHKEEQKTYDQRYCKAHREEKRAYDQTYRQAHREEKKAYQKAWRQTHKGQRNASKMLRRARQKGIATERIDFELVKRRDRMQCGICGKRVKPENLSFDHIIPLSKGGPHANWNLQVAHYRCNSARGPGRSPGQLRLAL